MASGFRSGALGGDERELRPVKSKSPMWQAGCFFTFAPIRAHHAGEVYPGCRLTPFALPWAMYFIPFRETHQCLFHSAWH